MVLENIQESTRDTRALDLCLKAFVAFFTISMFWAIVIDETMSILKMNYLVYG